MLFTSLLLPLITSSLTLAHPLPAECTCDNSPLPPSTIDDLIQMTLSRHLTPEECAFVCNPGTHSITNLIGPGSVPKSSPAPFNTEPKPLPNDGFDTEPPPLFDPPNARPAPLFDAPPTTPNAASATPVLRPPPLPLDRLTFHNHNKPNSEIHLSPFPEPVKADRQLVRQYAYNRAWYRWRVVGSLLVMFAFAVLAVEVGGSVMVFFVRYDAVQGESLR